jgi:hypothetical protein
MADREHHFVVVGRINDEGEISLYYDSDSTWARFEDSTIYDYGLEEQGQDGWVSEPSESQMADDQRIEQMLRDLLDTDGDASPY